ncbi:alpha/beta hydrolase [Phyllobacterium pellucidum]|uniref:alpha/beta hydrolase n=1 Tax=Phyllobacterium pellucidum TaxID=2740464 RepID=UPI001D14351C|nr:alpha/beta-hydrolase family protein [Phyllobacterium sp. T1018]UGY11391.1 alpha/beta-hydrolase family protein [Phyllobacterium sp. T1018]
MKAYLAVLAKSFSAIGLLVGILFFAASLTPSLMPRSYLVQGALSGFCAALGYGVGVACVWLWRYLEIPVPRARVQRAANWIAIIVCIGTAGVFLWKAAGWQNTVRGLMGLGPVESVEPIELAIIALVIFLVMIMLARLFRQTFRLFSRWLNRLVPRRISNLVGGVLAIILFWSVAQGILFKGVLRMVDTSFRELDARIDDGSAPPADPNKPGGPGSLLDWQNLGRQGRAFIATGPTGAEIGSFFNAKALDPVRVYVGLNAAETVDERARLALEELKRDGGFERSTLLVIVPTGTGWVDPEGIDTVEFLHHGDIASVAMQYSYLSSWLSLLVEPGYGAEAGQALFREVYRYWTTLPRDHRPKLYLYGLSLGAMNSELSAHLYDIIGDPFQGALWSGPPFQSRIWNSVTADRNPGSPAWLPRFRDGSVIRFTNQDNALNIPDAVWGPLRIVYLQYASDPVTFFDFHALYREPAWMQNPRGPDVSPSLRWIPGVTMLQLLFDMAIATTSPMGYGHVYAPEHYIDGWIAVTDPQGVTPEDLARLKTFFIKRSRSADNPPASD